MMSKIKVLTPAVALAALAIMVVSSAASAQTYRHRYNGPYYSHSFGNSYGSGYSQDAHPSQF
jgi:hypothetical protein